MKHTTIAAACLLIASAGAATASGDIVYSARYFSTAPSESMPHLHLYRINPDGSGRKQITFGDVDDDQPLWSPDGKSIVYKHGDHQIRVMDASTRLSRTIFTTPKDSDVALWGVYWWPDSKALVVVGNDNDFTGRVIDIATGKSTSNAKNVLWFEPSSDGDRGYVNAGTFGGEVMDLSDHKLTLIRTLPIAVKDAAWVTDSAMVGLESGDGDASDILVGFNENGTHLYSRPIHPQQGGDLGISLLAVRAIPNDRRNVVLCEDMGDSKTMINIDYWKASVDTGKATLWLHRKAYLKFKPRGQSYLAITVEALSDFGKTRGGHRKEVKTCGIEVGKDAVDDRPRSIVSGLVFVSFADWR